MPDEQSLYHLQIYSPGQTEDIMETFSSPVPFLPIHIGEVISPGSWGAETRNGMHTLRVTGIRHIVSQTPNGILHVLCVYTEVLPDTREYLLTGKPWHSSL